MATQNLFEKYGIKEVADVTFYRIERKNETYESQREITVASILKGAVEKKTVYPMVDGVSGEEGFEAYVFTDANILSGVEFDGDDPDTLLTEENTHKHEFSYEEQILMLFAKKQNLIDKTGVRFNFKENDIFETLEFNDEFAVAPSSTDKIVVLGIAGKFDMNLYNLEEVENAIKNLSTTYKAKAYDVVYKDYAELIVDDEMGYFNPKFIGTTYDKTSKEIAGKYNGEDSSLLKAEMWGEGCKSINDAILALRKKVKKIDQTGEVVNSGITSIKGGYPVNSELSANETDAEGIYEPINSKYALSAVLNALATTEETGDLTLTATTSKSNRAIYVDVNSASLSSKANIYILRNVNYKSLSTDEDGVFKFTDKVGNTVYYKDTIFAGVEYLALVIIGVHGLIFKVGRNGIRKIEQIAWMVNETGYINDITGEKLAKNGIIHTIDVTVQDETFEATCSVASIKVRKIQKTVNRYVPVLFLDTLKVSTIEQTAEQTAATGGKGNAQLIVWDYGKEITLTLEDALYSPASMSAMLGSYEGNDFTKGVKETKRIDRTEKCFAKRSFIVPAGNSKGVPSEGETTAQAVYIDPNTMQPYQDGTPIAEDEMFLKWTRSVAYGDNSLGHTIEISADKFPGTYKVVGDTFARNKTTGEDQRFQFVVPQAKMTSEQTITLEAEGDPTVFNLNLTVLRPDDGVMVKLIQYDVVENEEENDGSTMVKGTENLNLLDDAEMFKVSSVVDEDDSYIGATEY